MAVSRFALSSDQLELLLAFERCKGLTHLAETLGRDPSVISRGLQRVAEDFPVLVKVKGKWKLTPLGKKTNELTRKFLEKQTALLSSAEKIADRDRHVPPKDAVLVVINAQQGLLDATQLGRNNSEAEKNIELLLKHWREKRMPILHVKHVSDNPSSVFFRGSSGCDFLPESLPLSSEPVVEKTKSSGFQDTSLEERLKAAGSLHIVLVGFTANECIDATARDASVLGFTTHVISDATAMFDMKSADGKLLKAERLHRLTLANIHAFYAKVINTQSLLGS